LRDHTDRLFPVGAIFRDEDSVDKDELDERKRSACGEKQSRFLLPATARVSTARTRWVSPPNPNPGSGVGDRRPGGPGAAYLGADGLEKGIPREDVVVHASSSQHHDVRRQAVCNYAVSILANQEAAHDGTKRRCLLDPQGFRLPGSGETCFMACATASCNYPNCRGATRDHARDHHQRSTQPASRHPACWSEHTRDEIYVADEAFQRATAAEVRDPR